MITTHVLDTSIGRPAAGVGVVLESERDTATWMPVGRGATDGDGRLTHLVPEGTRLPAGTYRLTFDVAGYFARRGARLATPPFLGVVPVRFAIGDPGASFHVPLLCSPWSYATYRGS